MSLNPLFFVGVGAAALFIYESNKAANIMNAARAPKTKHIPLASSHFTDLKENPFQQKEKITILAMHPTQRGQLDNPRLAGRWMLTLPGGALMPIHASFNTLKRKVVLINPELPELVHGKPPSGLVEVGEGSYQMADMSALKLFEQ